MLLLFVLLKNKDIIVFWICIIIYIKILNNEVTRIS